MTGQQFQKDFGLFAKDRGVSSMNLHYANQMLEQNSMTPYILEERQLNVSQLDIFSRMMYDRILWLTGTVNDNMSIIAQAQLMYLDSINSDDITLQISSGGGSVSAGLGIVDIMDYVASDIQTINMGLAASMGSILLGAGTVGKRKSLRFAKTMLHQSSGGASGVLADAEITMAEWRKTNEQLFNLLGVYCNKSPEQVKLDATRDLWLSSQEALDYGIIDDIITKKIKKD